VSKTRLLVAIVAAALVVPALQAGAKGKPAKPPVTAQSVIEGEVHSARQPVNVGRNELSYGAPDQQLFIHESLLPETDPEGFPGVVARLKDTGYAGGYYGPYFGQVRVLNNRLDYYFDTSMGCAQPDASLNLCPFRLIVVDGTAVYTGTGKRKTLAGVAFVDGRTLVDYRACNPADNPACYVKLYGCYDDRDCPGVEPGGAGYVCATLNVWFQR
jgi:hypothetical protein